MLLARLKRPIGRITRRHAERSMVIEPTYHAAQAPTMKNHAAMSVHVVFPVHSPMQKSHEPTPTVNSRSHSGRLPVPLGQRRDRAEEGERPQRDEPQGKAGLGGRQRRDRDRMGRA